MGSVSVYSYGYKQKINMGELTKKSHEIASSPNEVANVLAQDTITLDPDTTIGKSSEVGVPNFVKRIARIELGSTDRVEVVRSTSPDGEVVFQIVPLVETQDTDGEIKLVQNIHKARVIENGSLRLGRAKSEVRSDGKTPVELDIDLTELGFLNYKEGEKGGAHATFGLVSREQIEINIVDGVISVKNLAVPNQEDPSAGMFKVEKASTVPEEDPEVTLKTRVVQLLPAPPLSEIEVSADLTKMADEARTAVDRASVQENPIDVAISVSKELIDDQKPIPEGDSKVADPETESGDDRSTILNFEKPKGSTDEIKAGIAGKHEEADRATAEYIDELVADLGGTHAEAFHALTEITDRVEATRKIFANALESGSGNKGFITTYNRLERSVETLSILYQTSNEAEVRQIAQEVGQYIEESISAWKHGATEIDSVTRPGASVLEGADRSLLADANGVFSQHLQRETGADNVSEVVGDLAEVSRQIDQIIPNADALIRNIPAIDFETRARRLQQNLGYLLENPKILDDPHLLIQGARDLQNETSGVIQVCKKIIDSCKGTAGAMGNVAFRIDYRGRELRTEQRGSKN